MWRRVWGLEAWYSRSKFSNDWLSSRVDIPDEAYAARMSLSLIHLHILKSTNPESSQSEHSYLTSV